MRHTDPVDCSGRWLSARHWPNGRRVSARHWPNGRRVSARHWPNGRRVSARYWPNGRWVSARHWPNGRWVSAWYWPNGRRVAVDDVKWMQQLQQEWRRLWETDTRHSTANCQWNSMPLKHTQRDRQAHEDRYTQCHKHKRHQTDRQTDRYKKNKYYDTEN